MCTVWLSIENPVIGEAFVRLASHGETADILLQTIVDSDDGDHDLIVSKHSSFELVVFNDFQDIRNARSKPL